MKRDERNYVGTVHQLSCIYEIHISLGHDKVYVKQITSRNNISKTIIPINELPNHIQPTVDEYFAAKYF